MHVQINLLVTLFICQGVFGQQNTLSKPKEMSQCQTELRVTDEEIVEYIDKKQKPFNEKMKCFIKCLGEKFGVFKDGKIVDSKILADIKENTKFAPANFEREMKIYNDCKDKNGKDACETAAVIYNCVLNAAKAWTKAK